MIKNYGQKYERWGDQYAGSGGYGGITPTLLPDGTYDYSGTAGRGYMGGGGGGGPKLPQAPSMMQNIGYGASAIAGLANAYTSYQGLKLAKKQYQLGKAATMANYRQNAASYNADLEYRQKQRIMNANAAEARGAQHLNFQGVNDYMQQYGANTNMLNYAQGYQSPTEIQAQANSPQGDLQQYVNPAVPQQQAIAANAAATNTASTSTVNQKKLKSI